MGASEAAARYTSRVTPHNVFGVISGEMHYADMTFLPTLISTLAYRQVLIEEPENLRFMWNSLILVVPIVVGQLVIAPLAAYGFERARSRHKEKLYFAYIIILLLPMQALLVPHFIAAGFLGIRSYNAIILPAIFGPFGVFLVRQQMKGFNKEILEAAKVDGANELRIFRSIVLPNIKPTLTALGVLAFAEAWNIVDQAVVFISDPFEMPMSVHLSTGLTDNIGIVFALSTLFMIPALIVFIYGQDDLGEGLVYAGRK
jgi:multiple sugar transport system permease protein